MKLNVDKWFSTILCLFCCLLQNEIQATQVCPSGWLFFHSPRAPMCYKFYDSQSITFSAGKSLCEQDQATLIMVKNSAEKRFFLANIQQDLVSETGVPNSRYMLGATASSSAQFKWLDGEDVDVSLMPWLPGEPSHSDETCLAYIGIQGGVNDYWCSDEDYYRTVICEKQANVPASRKMLSDPEVAAISENGTSNGTAPSTLVCAGNCARAGCRLATYNSETKQCHFFYPQLFYPGNVIYQHQPNDGTLSVWTVADKKVEDDSCQSGPCQNNALCIDGLGGTYTCSCVCGFTGYNCEITVNFTFCDDVDGLFDPETGSCFKQYTDLKNYTDSADACAALSSGGWRGRLAVLPTLASFNLVHPLLSAGTWTAMRSCVSDNRDAQYWHWFEGRVKAADRTYGTIASTNGDCAVTWPGDSTFYDDYCHANNKQRLCEFVFEAYNGSHVGC